MSIETGVQVRRADWLAGASPVTGEVVAMDGDEAGVRWAGNLPADDLAAELIRWDGDVAWHPADHLVPFDSDAHPDPTFVPIAELKAVAALLAEHHDDAVAAFLSLEAGD